MFCALKNETVKNIVKDFLFKACMSFFTERLRAILCKHLNFLSSHINRFCRTFSKMQTDLIKILKSHFKLSIYWPVSMETRSKLIFVFPNWPFLLHYNKTNAASSTIKKHRIKPIKTSASYLFYCEILS